MVAAVGPRCAFEQARCFKISSCCNECLQVVQQGLEVLCVSQFTLFNTMKGNKPDFHLAMPPTQVDLSYNSLDEQNYLIFNVHTCTAYTVFRNSVEFQIIL